MPSPQSSTGKGETLILCCITKETCPAPVVPEGCDEGAIHAEYALCSRINGLRFRRERNGRRGEQRRIGTPHRAIKHKCAVDLEAQPIVPRRRL